MHKLVAVLALNVSLLIAEPFGVDSPLQTLNDYRYETPHGRQMKIPRSTQLVVIAFEKNTGALVNDFLNTQDPFYMSKHRAVFIADINKMPRVITNLFALPKMQKYKHLVYLHYDEKFQNFVPHKEEKITLARIEDGKVQSISYISTTEELKAAIQK